MVNREYKLWCVCSARQAVQEDESTGVCTVIETPDLLYEQMSAEPLQAVILAKREKNGNASPTGCAATRRRAYGTIALFDGAELPIYDRERTICDCFKYRTKLDSEIISKAINAYVADDHKNLRNLSAYAKKLGLYKRVSDLMEVMLGG